MFGLKDKVAAIIAGSLSLLLAGALAFVWISKDAEIGSLTKQNGTLQTLLDRSNADLAQCRVNRITLELATARQNAAVAEAKREGEARLAALARTAEAAKASAATARAKADAILSRPPATDDACADANALIEESLS